MNADGTGQRNLTRNAANDFLWLSSSSWSPDGRKIAFGRDRDGNGSSDDIYVINADGSGQRRLTQDGQQPLWSPDGQKIAFRSKRNGNDDIYVMNPDGSGQRNLTRNPARIDDLVCLVARAEIGRDSSASCERPPGCASAITPVGLGCSR